MGITFNNSDIVNIDTETGLKMLDKLSRIKDDRRAVPLLMEDNIQYHHRELYDGYNLQIGDAYFMIPPEFIMVNSEATSQSLVTLRQENTQKMKSGYHKRTILIDLVFNGLEQLNGYPVDGPEGTYYVDGLRQLLAQFKCTPFLPISNELINGVYNVFTVALQAITISTVQGFPNVMTAQITLQEVNMYPYIEMPDVCFKYMIDWDLFRYYYQKFLTEKHVYKRLQSLPANKEYNRFKISVLDDSVFTSSEATKANLLNIICDAQIVRMDENGSYADSNYITWVDSEESNVSISSFQCGYSNLLTNIQMSDIPSPTLQFIGGMDTIYNITFETTDYSVVQSLEQCQITNDLLTRNNIKLRSVGFVKLESELVEFTGSLFVMIESVTTNTVPGFPGLYNVQIQCVSYDIAQSDREDLNGFLPFECKKDGRCGEYDEDNGFVSDHVHDEEAIEQTMDGLKTKIKQDNYAEWKIRTSMEVYPDLHLPKYSEVNQFITKCIDFRKKHGLGELPYTQYPTNPIGMLHGSNPKNNITVNVSHGIAYSKDIDRESLEYDIYVDPDFYVFYPCSYMSFQEEARKYAAAYYEYEPPQRSSFTKTKTKEKTPNYGEGSVDSNLIEQFIALAKTFIGHSYVLGAEGEISDEKGLCFDCSGFVTYLLKEIGVMPVSKNRFVVSTIPKDDLFTEMSWSEMQRGDILCNADLSHVVIYEGDNQVIHASNSNPYPKGGVKESSLYFTGGRCFRPKAFMQETTSSESNVEINDGSMSNVEQIWNLLKSYGCTDIAAAAIIGNMGRETGGTFNPRIVEGMTYSDTIPTAGGYGLVQYTYKGYKTGLQSYCDKSNFGVNTIEGQVGYLMTVISGTKYFEKMNSTDDIAEATRIFQDDFEKPGVKAFDERLKYAKDAYEKYKRSGGNSASSSDANTITEAEFESICRIVMAETKGETSDTEKAVAQVIYDRLTHPNKKFGGLSNILNSTDQFKAPYQGELNSTVKNNVTDVFCKNKKFWSEYQAWYFLTPEDTNATFRDRDANYDRLGEVGKHVFWGEKTKGSNIKYKVVDSNGTSDTSKNTVKEDFDILHDAKTADDISRFAEPVLAKTDAIIYDDGWRFWRNGTAKDNSKEHLNDGLNIFYTSFCDEYQYSCRGRLVRAFPAYLFCILDDKAQWYDGRKLWTNYYIHKSVVDIAIHGTNDMPTETATITITNSYHNLDRTQGGLDSYSIENDTGYKKWVRSFYKFSGLLIGTPKLTNKLIELQQVIYDHAKLRAGARIHLRVGYGSDPLSLAPVMNGHVSDVSLGDQISIIVTSDGSELIQHVVSAKENDTNNGLFGLFGFFEQQESSNIIANIMCKRQSWFNYIASTTFEGSAYSIEHFGLFFNTNAMKLISNVAIGTTIGAFAAGLPGALVGAGLATLTSLAFNENASLSDLWDGYQEQYDICKNIYKSDYSREHYIYSDIAGKDNEQNFVFNQFNMTPWDVFQISTQQVPEYIVKVSYHQFDSRLYFGLPMWMEKYRYNYLSDKVYEECKASTQVHVIDCCNIIDNQVRVTSKFSNTNIKVMYTRGSKPVSTDVIHSDDTIDYAYQKTSIIDTTITQDAIGLDAFYEFLGYDLGESSARRIGISNLLYGWQQQYQGSIILTGCPGIKSHDYLMIYDAFGELYGIAIAREVTHSFNINTGFTTSVVLGMIGFSTDEESGMIQTCQNLLMVLNCFSSYIETRRQLRNEYEKNANIFSEYEIISEKIRKKLKGEEVASFVATVGFVGLSAYKVIRYKKAIDNFIQVTDAFKEAYKIAKGTTTGIRATLAAIKTGTITTAGAFTGGVGAIAFTLLFFAIDLLIQEIFEWFSNKNVCVLLPLWWNGYPFVSGVNNGRKILLIRDNPTNDSIEEAPNFND